MGYGIIDIWWWYDDDVLNTWVWNIIYYRSERWDKKFKEKMLEVIDSTYWYFIDILFGVGFLAILIYTLYGR